MTHDHYALTGNSGSVWLLIYWGTPYLNTIPFWYHLHAVRTSAGAARKLRQLKGS